jgi:N-acetylmuramoyl-L-alanine amidase/Bacterial SH3 domain
MKTKFGFTQFTIQEFETYVKSLKVGRTILYIQEHHTFSPDYQLCAKHTPFELQRGMRNYHMSQGWKDIGQHFSTFPDGTILTGRSMEEHPACIVGFNTHAICIENVGNFDIGHDVMTAAQKDTIIKMNAILANKFSIPITTDRIVYHHWFDLKTGERNNGSKNNKSCPGTAFFGGNKVADCQANFIPLVQQVANGITSTNPVTIQEYRIITANELNVRVAASSSAKKATDRAAIPLGSVLRVFEEKDGWYKISSSSQHWISGKFTQNVTRATVNADTLNVRSGAATNFAKVGNLTKGTEVFILEEKNGWSKIGLETKWVKTSFLDKK